MDFNRNQNEQIYNSLMDLVNIASFIIGLQNLELNVTANDLDKQTNAILNDLHEYFAEQDKHLIKQDSHLAEQDERLDRLERLLSVNVPYDRKESKR